MASAPDPRGTWWQRHPRCHAALYVAAAIVAFPVLIAWVIASVREARR